MTQEVIEHHMNELNLDLQRFAGEGAAGDGAAGEAAEAGAVEAAQDELLTGKPEEEAVLEPEEKEAQPGLVTEEAEAVPVGPEPGPEPEKEPEAEKPGSLEERLAALEEALARQNELYMQREQDLALRQHFSALEKQAETMRETFPGFDLKTELNDPVFVRLTSPMVGLSVEDAYYAIHHREITGEAARAAAEMIGNSVQAGRNMPNENGAVQRGTPEGGYRPLAELSPEERRMRMDMIRSGKLRFD